MWYARSYKYKWFYFIHISYKLIMTKKYPLLFYVYHFELRYYDLIINVITLCKYNCLYIKLNTFNLVKFWNTYLKSTFFPFFVFQEPEPTCSDSSDSCTSMLPNKCFGRTNKKRKIAVVNVAPESVRP